ncbi:MAG: hypothetical protein LDLANPLL_01572 [Turneriella sp.]|nr:hypothetical protein [Turneriella sp.]
MNTVGGVFGGGQNVNITSTTPGANICYTIDSAPPTCATGTCDSGMVYTGTPITVSTTQTIRTIACLGGYTDSASVSNAYTIDTVPPSTPASVTLTPMSTSEIRLTWPAATDNVSVPAALVYEICRSTTAGGCSTFSVTATTPSGATQYNDYGLSTLTTYYYTVSARDEAGNVGTAGTEISATTLSAGTVATPVFTLPPCTYTFYLSDFAATGRSQGRFQFQILKRSKRSAASYSATTRR